MTKYFIYKTNYSQGKLILESEQIRLNTKKTKNRINEGDKFLVYLKDKNILALGFSIREIEDTKPYNARINFLPHFISNFKPDTKFDTRGRFIEISEETYSRLKASMEASKVSEYSDLKNFAQKKGAEFEEEIYNFFKDIFAPLSDSSEVSRNSSFEIENGKIPYQIDVLIKFKDYEILCDAFTNKKEIDAKINKVNSIASAVEDPKKQTVRFILFYKGDKRELSFNQNKLNDITIILDKTAKEYYEYIFNTTFIPNNKPTAIAAYHLLGELNIQIKDQTLKATPYIKLNDGENLVYIFKKDVKEIIPLLYVARRERGKNKFYQRLLKRNKLYGSGSIDDYLDISNESGEREHTTFLNSIIISPEEIKETNDGLEMPFKYGSTAILDGQHRAYGAYLNEVKLGKNIELYFTAIVDKNNKMLPLEKQQEYFISINMEQTKVDPEQIWRAYSELSSYKNKSNGIISAAVKMIEEKRILKIKRNIQHGDEKGLSFSGVCVNLEKLFADTKLLDKERVYEDKEINKYVDMTFRLVQNLIEIINDKIDEENREKILKHDGYVSIIFKLYTKILKANNNDVNKKVLEPYFSILSEFLKTDKNLINRLETSGEGLRQKSADLLASMINSKLPKDVNTLSVKKGGGLETPILEEIGNMLSKIATINPPTENGQRQLLIKPTPMWMEGTIKLNKPVTNYEDFSNNVINVLYQILYEGGKNIPEEFRKDSVLTRINALRTWMFHDVVGHGDPKDREKKRKNAENAVEYYISIKAVPQELNVQQLEDLKNKLLEDVYMFLNELYDKYSNS